MGIETNIGWCDSTVNPTTGCEGCELFAEYPVFMKQDSGLRPGQRGRIPKDKCYKEMPALGDEKLAA